MSYNTNMGVTFDAAVTNNIFKYKEKNSFGDIYNISKGKEKKNIDNLKSVAKNRQVYLMYVVE